MMLNHISATERWDQKRIPAFLLAVSPFLQTSQKKKKNCLNPLQQHQQGPRNIHCILPLVFFLQPSFNMDPTLCTASRQIEQTTQNPVGRFKKKRKRKRETNTRGRNEAIRHLAFLIESHLIAAEPAADVRQMSRWVACNN